MSGWKKDDDDVRNDFDTARSNSTIALNGVVSALTPLANQLNNKSDAEINRLYPVKGAKLIAAREWLTANKVSFKGKVDELLALLLA